MREEQKHLVTCGTRRYLPNGALNVCTNEATHAFVTPYGTKKTACADCAQQYVYAGYLVAPIESFCNECLRVKPKVAYELRCWCGGKGTRHNVDGFWLVLCEMHQPPRIYSLWHRLWLSVVYRLTKPFRKPRKLSAVEMARLTEIARNRALKEHKR